MCKFTPGFRPEFIRHRVMGPVAGSQVEHSRRLVRLAPGELPDRGLSDPGIPGFRLESDAEFRERLLRPISDGV